MDRPVNQRLMNFVAAVLLALAGLSNSAAFAALDPTEQEAFKAAYGRYQQAIEDKDAEDAAAAAKEALDLGPKILDDNSPSMAALYVNYGMALVDAKKGKEAIEPLHEGREAQRQNA